MDHNTEKIIEIVETFVRGINGSQRRGVPWAIVPGDSLEPEENSIIKATKFFTDSQSITDARNYLFVLVRTGLVCHWEEWFRALLPSQDRTVASAQRQGIVR